MRAPGFRVIAPVLVAVLFMPPFGAAARGVAGDQAPGPLARHEVIEAALRAVVEVRSKIGASISTGSGFLIASDGVVVTNLHVVEGCSEVAVRLATGEVYDQVLVLAFDRGRDLVLLKIAGYNLPVLRLADSDTIRVGDPVLILGHPSGLEHSAAGGIVSSIRVLEGGVRVIQTDAAASPGNSGGPLLAESGDVIGVISFKIGGENLNFAVPSNYVQGLTTVTRQMTLAEFQSALASGSGLFAEGQTKSTGASGRWRSLQSNTVKILKQEGDFIYGESISPTSEQTSATYDLRKSEDGTFRGKVRGFFSCQYYALKAFPAEWRQNHCSEESEIALTNIGPTRIEGRILVPTQPDGPNNSRAWAEFCRTCGRSLPKKWEQFTWVRMD